MNDDRLAATLWSSQCPSEWLMFPDEQPHYKPLVIMSIQFIYQSPLGLLVIAFK